MHRLLHGPPERDPPLELVGDGARDEEQKLGAIGDLRLALDTISDRDAPVLVVAALAVVVHNVRFFSQTTPAEDVTAEAPDGEEVATEPDHAALAPVDPVEVAAYLGGLPDDPRNPFLTRAEADRLASPGDAASGGAERFPVLGGTLWSPDRRVAWIGGAPRIEGDALGGMVLERIEPGRVTVRLHDERLALEVVAPPAASVSEPRKEGP